MTAWELFFRDLVSGNLSHAYMVTSPDTRAVTAFLRRTVQSVVCRAAEKPCGKCLDCRKANGGTHPDVFWIPEEGKKILVDDVSLLVDNCYTRPLEAECKVFVLDNFDETNEKAQNKLLKILEEPVKNTIFLLGAAGERSVLPTVRSRVKKIFIEDNLDFLLSNENPEQAAVRGYIADMYKHMKKSSDLLDYVNIFARYKNMSGEFLSMLELFTRDIILSKTGNADLILYKGQKNDIMAAGEEYSLPALTAILKNISETRRRLDFNVNLIPALDNLLYGILEAKYRN